MALVHWTGYADGYTLGDLETRILFNLGQVASGAASYSRYPRTQVLQAINEAQRFIAVRVPSIRKICIVNTTADKGWYLCPMNMIPKGIISAYYYQTTTEYDKLLIWDRHKLDRVYDGWRTADSGDPEVIVPGLQMYGNRFTFEVYPMPDSSGAWTVQPDGVYLGGAPGTTTSSVTGTATGGSTTSLVDSTVDFTTLGLAEGMAVWNVTEDAYSYISVIAANTITLGAALTGAASFAAGNSYEIVTDFAGVISAWDDEDEQYIFMAETGEISSLSPAAGNILLEYFAYPINLYKATDYPQLPLTLQDALIDIATARLARMGHEKTRQMALAVEYEAKGLATLEPFVGDAHGDPFEHMPVRMRVRYR